MLAYLKDMIDTRNKELHIMKDKTGRNDKYFYKEYKMTYITNILIISAVIILSICLNGEMAIAGDFDDGISTYKDESIEDDSKLGDADININFIVLDAISSAKMKEDDDNVNISDGSGDSNKNSVVCEVGSDCSGPIYNIDLD